MKFEDTEAISGVFDAASGRLTLIGKATIEEYQQAIQSITFGFPGSESAPREENESLFVSANDGVITGVPSELAINITDNPSKNTMLDIPSGFTPNGDAINDTWVIRPLESPEVFANAMISVYSKNGQLVFQSTGLNDEWDGRYKGNSLPPDVYFYTIEVNGAQRRGRLKGTVTILR